MNVKNVVTVLAGLALVASPLTALAQTPRAATTTQATTTDARAAARIAEAKQRALREIDRRIASLQALDGRISQMSRLPDSSEAELTTIIDGQITALTALRGQIEAATDVATLRPLIASITDSYRIYALILPQIQIIAAADRALAVVAQLEALATKLEARINEAETGGADVTELEAMLADMRSAINDAEKNANDAVEAVESLRPDNGNDTLRNANHESLKEAHAKVRLAQQNLVAARKAGGEIVSELRALAKANTATTTPSTATTTDAD